MHIVLQMFAPFNLNWVTSSAAEPAGGVPSVVNYMKITGFIKIKTLMGSVAEPEPVGAGVKVRLPAPAPP